MFSKEEIEEFRFHLNLMYEVQKELERRLKDRKTSKEDRNFAIRNLHECAQLICKIRDILKCN